MCAFLFFVRELGMIQVRAFSSSSFRFELSHFFTTLTCQRQEFNNSTVRVRHLSCAENNGSELLV